jgi:2-amino-1-hydroxyethylphosphonate dioxygenase (glycine-forming)
MKQDELIFAEEIKRVLKVLEAASDAEYIGEPVSQLAHGLQAAHLAQEAQQPEVVILASLFHDIGHLIDPDLPQMDGLGVIDHEGLGARFLADLGFSETLCYLVRAHVQGKRYLCQRKAGYHDALSSASRGTLEWQGGPMSPEEAQTFETDPWFKTILRMRVFDDRAKDPTAAVPSLETYRPMMARHLRDAQGRESP